MSEEVEAIKASDLLKLMKVVEMATGLYNAMEKYEHDDLQWHPWVAPAHDELGDALRDLGLAEVKP